MSILSTVGLESYLFVAKWSPLSHMLAKDFVHDNFVKIVDVEAEPVLADSNDIITIPTLIVKRGDEELYRRTGAFSYHEVIEQISLALRSSNV